MTFTGVIQWRRYGLHLHDWHNVRSTCRLKANLCEVTQHQCGRKESVTFIGVMRNLWIQITLQEALYYESCRTVYD